MAKKETTLAGRAWSLVRLALLWARRGGVFKRGFMADLFPRYLKSLRASVRRINSIGYPGERELSFEQMPSVHFKFNQKALGWTKFKYLPAISCINPTQVLVKEDEDEQDHRMIYNSFNVDNPTSSHVLYNRDHAAGIEIEEDGRLDEEGSNDDIDIKAQKFIERFYREMRMQRQVSYIEYNEQLESGVY